MGKLGDAFAAPPDRDRGGATHQLRVLFDLLGDDADDLRAAFDGPLSARQIQQVVEKHRPDLPRYKEGAWARWVREWRRDGRKF